MRRHGKRFHQETPGPDGQWRAGLNGVKPHLYRQDKLKALKVPSAVLVTEGEKDVHTAELLGFTATTAPMGALKWRSEYSEDLRGHHVCVIADNDEPGRKHAQEVAQSLHGIAASVRVIEALPGVPEKGDLSDWHATGGTYDELRQIIKDTPEYVPSTLPESPFLVPAGTGNEKPKLRIVSLPELLAEPEEEVEWQWDGIMIAGGTSLIAAKPKTMKSTLSRAIAFKTATGEAVLGRACRQGPVLYIGVEEKRSRLADIYRQMHGAPEDLFIHVGPPPERPIEALYDAVAEYKPVLVIIDPILKFIRVKDSNDYAVMSAALAPIEAIARDTGAHIAMTHHLGKSDREDGDQILGSTAIFAAVDSVIIIRRQETRRALSTVQRFGEDIEPVVVELGEDGIPAVAGSVEGYEIRKAANGIINYLSTVEETGETEIRSAVEGKTTHIVQALRQLVDDHAVTREGAGKRNNPYRYSLNHEPAPKPPPAIDHEKLGNVVPVPPYGGGTRNEKHFPAPAEPVAKDHEEDLPWPTNGHIPDEPFDPAKVKAWDEVELDF